MRTLSLAAPLVLFERGRQWAGTGFSPSPFLSSSSFHTTQLQYTNSYTYSHPNLNLLQHCKDTLTTRNVVFPSGPWFENRPHLTPSIRLGRNPKRVIVQWVGIRTDRHFHKLTKLKKNKYWANVAVRKEFFQSYNLLYNGGEGYWDFRTSDLIKNPDGTDI